MHGFQEFLFAAEQTAFYLSPAARFYAVMFCLQTITGDVNRQKIHKNAYCA